MKKIFHKKISKKIGKFLIIAPIISCILLLIIFLSINTFVSNVISDPTRKFLNGLLSICGVINLTLIILGLLFGIIFLNKKDMPNGIKYDHRSGKKHPVIPGEIKKFNLGAAGMGSIWGVYYNVYISLLDLIVPFGAFFLLIFAYIVNMSDQVNILVGFAISFALGICALVKSALIFFLGAHGNELAWSHNKWQNIKQFNSAQKKWAYCGILFLLPQIYLIYLGFYYLLIAIFALIFPLGQKFAALVASI